MGFQRACPDTEQDRHFTSKPVSHMAQTNTTERILLLSLNSFIQLPAFPFWHGVQAEYPVPTFWKVCTSVLPSDLDHHCLFRFLFIHASLRASSQASCCRCAPPGFQPPPDLCLASIPAHSCVDPHTGDLIQAETVNIALLLVHKGQSNAPQSPCNERSCSSGGENT